MNYCKDCKHFGPSFGEQHGFHECERIRHDKELNIYDDAAEFPTEKAVLVDAERYCADIMVKEDFGCNLFDSRKGTIK